MHWKTIGAAIRGRAHHRRGLPCQDAFNFAIQGKYWIGAVADGAGSARFSRTGARFAVLSTVRGMASAIAKAPEAPWEQLQRQMAWQVFVARATLLDAARREHLPCSAYATTLQLVVASPGITLGAQIGDGATIVGTSDGAFHTLTSPKKGVFYNMTTFLTDPKPSLVFRKIRQPGLSRIGMITDGLELASLEHPGYTPFGPFFGPMFAFLENSKDTAEANSVLRRFLVSNESLGRITDDDLTLVMTSLEGKE